MFDSLTGYFLQNPPYILAHLYLPMDSPVWAGSLGIAHVNLSVNSSLPTCNPELLTWAITYAFLRKDEAFLHQLNIIASRVIKIAREDGAIHLWNSEAQF